MSRAGLADMSVAQIMANWPTTIRVFIAHRMHCVGCPIAPFHTLTDAADEHHLDLGGLTAAVQAEIDRIRADRA